MNYRSHLVIPDSHAHPSYDNKRFEWLGKLILDLKPDVVVHLGDFSDMPSLSSYDVGTKGFEGKRYSKDVECAIDAQERMFHPLRRAKKKLPQMEMLIGNHEYRINRAISYNAAQLDGVISIDDLQYKKFGWNVTPYRGGTPGIRTIDGINYAHFFTSGVMGRAISGIHPAYQLLSKQYQSCTQGHTHTTDYCLRTNAAGQFIQGMVAGVYQDWEADFAGVANDLWWRGVIMKRRVMNGTYDPEWIGLDAIKEAYS